MIAAGFLPACAAAWHRGVLALVGAGWWSDLPGAHYWAPVAWLAVPAALVTAAAIVFAATSRVRAWLITLGVAALVHLWLPLPLAPLALAVRRWPEPRRAVMPAVVALGIGLVARAAVPECAVDAASSITVVAVLGAWFNTIGLTGAILLLIDAGFSRGGRRAQAAATAALAMTGLLLVSGHATDGAALVGASAAVLWWRIGEGALHVLGWQTTTAARAAAVVLILLVPALAARSARLPPAATSDPNARDMWRALNAAASPAVFMRTGGAADVATTIWRGGRSGAQRSLAVIPADPSAAEQHLATRAVYAWPSIARQAAMRGMLLAPVLLRNAPLPVMWRVLTVESCTPLSPAWSDVAHPAGDGQFTAQLPSSTPPAMAERDLASAHRLSPAPFDWVPGSAESFDVRSFDRETADEQEALDAAVGEDAWLGAAFGNARYVTRLRIGRPAAASDMLAVTLGGVATAAWARSTSVAAHPGPASLCRNTYGQPLTGYAGAPPAVTIDIASVHAIGGGWHALEQDGDSRFRWTAAPQADLLVFVQRPEPLVLALDAEPATRRWSAAALRVTVNGANAACRSRVPPCDWILPPKAMRSGLNVITLHSVTVAGPVHDTRRLGLMVRGATLSRP